MKNCKKCGEQIPAKIVIDGKQRNLQKRKFCLECSPFGKHNTRDLNSEPSQGLGPRPCSLCGNTYNNKGKKCWTCATRLGRKRKDDKLHGFIGEECWVCGYDKCRAALDLHHVDPSTKKFQLSSREMQYKWDRVWEEAQKCCLLCCRCHREVHAGLTDVEELYKTKWKEILGR